MSNPDDENVASVMNSIEIEFLLAELEKRGCFAVAIAQVAGAVHRSALESGVPYNLATEMAQDYWNSEMIPREVIEAGNAADDE
ncbi:hypothetical protein [Actinacidiphila oryziradicis]|uniref:hypothetical protein n=1 Tax=Actinacidiphila oryziradicis TaxID=2571141 RepID=UPI0023F42D21|nr:hypothetical protein [Actinacidiphila oryziradicis]MCW2870333.1 hypothetical protein [Actinacidiphila oryziradicis]